MNLYLVENSDGGGGEYAHLFKLRDDTAPETADMILGAVMSMVMQEAEWTWDDAIAILERDCGWVHLPFRVAPNAY